jgi:hypothetical protein
MVMCASECLYVCECVCVSKEREARHIADDINIKTESDPPTFFASRAGPSVRASAPVVVDQVDAGAGVLAGRGVALVEICATEGE